MLMVRLVFGLDLSLRSELGFGLYWVKVYFGGKAIILAWVLVRTRARIMISVRDRVRVLVLLKLLVLVLVLCQVQPGWGLNVPG